jgi:hypothetical protein
MNRNVYKWCMLILTKDLQDMRLLDRIVTVVYNFLINLYL